MSLIFAAIASVHTDILRCSHFTMCFQCHNIPVCFQTSVYYCYRHFAAPYVFTSNGESHSMHNFIALRDAFYYPLTLDAAVSGDDLREKPPDFLITDVTT